jgi:hypothetical protein
MWLHRKCAGTGLWEVIRCHHDSKLYYRDMGISALVQLNIANYSKIETAIKPKERHCRNGSAEQAGEFTAKELREINCCRIYL